MGGVRNGVAEEDSHQDLNPVMAAMRVGTTWFWGPRGGSLYLGIRRTRCNRYAELSLSSSEEHRRDSIGLGTGTM